jgi:hypothetical protein
MTGCLQTENNKVSESLKKTARVGLIATCFAMCNAVLATEVKVLAQGGVVASDDSVSWYDGGRSVYRYTESGVNLTQFAVELKHELTPVLSANVVANASSEPEFQPGISQAYVHYQPLSPGAYRWRVKAGAFYPRLSFENVDMAWISPFNYTNSAINTWIGEALRIQGVEVALSKSGRKARSPHSFTFVGSVFGGHDTFGIEISQRGWTLHDRQSVLSEDFRIPRPNSEFADNRFQGFINFDPFEEIDDRPGYYLGTHWNYRNKSDLRYYFYDNRVDSTERGKTVLAWNTFFHHVGWQYFINPNLRLISQVISGETKVNDGAVKTEFTSGFVMLSYRYKDKHRLSARIEAFDTSDIDGTPGGNLESNGKALTSSWRYDLNENWQAGIEYSVADVKLPSFSSQSAQSETQNLIQAVIQYRLD